MAVVVDSCGWIEFLARGPNAALFGEQLQATSNVLVPTVVIYEVTRYARRVGGDAAAERILAHMHQAAVVDFTMPIAIEAAQVGPRERLAMADSIILTTARLHGATLWTQDAHFEGLAGVHYIPTRTN
jgi:toxin FitB